MTKHTQPAHSLREFGDLLFPFANQRLKLLTHIKDALGHGPGAKE